MIRLSRKANGNLRLEQLRANEQDLNRISLLPEKNLRVKRKDGYDHWDHWELPWEDLKEVLENWKEDELLLTPEVKELKAQYEFEMIPLDELPRIKKPVFTWREPLDHQDKYIRMTRRRPRTLCSFDVGAGKSLAALERARRFEFTRMIIATPQTQVDGWVEEARNAYNLEPCIFMGDKKEREKILDKMIGMHSIVVATYESLHELDPEEFLFDSFIFDEAHLWSNPDTVRYKDLQRLFKASYARPGICAQALTATPIGNKIVSIWPFMHFAYPLVAGSRKAFRDKHEQVEQYGYRNFTEVDDDGNVTRSRAVEYARKVIPINLDKLADKVLATTARMSGELVYLFKNSINYIKTPMTADQQIYYEEARDDLLDTFEMDRLGMGHAQVKMLRLLQIAEGTHNHPDWQPGDSYESSKLDYVHQRIADRIKIGKKTVFWSRFKKSGRIIQDQFPGVVAVYDGDQSIDMKRLVKWAFQGVSHPRDLERYYEIRQKINRSLARKGEPLFLLEPGEASVFTGVIDMRAALGMNLQICDYQIFGSWSFSCIADIQAAGRIIRLGQASSRVTSEFLVATGTWEMESLKYILGLYGVAKGVLDGKESLERDQYYSLYKMLQRERRAA